LLSAGHFHLSLLYFFLVSLAPFFFFNAAQFRLLQFKRATDVWQNLSNSERVTVLFWELKLWVCPWRLWVVAAADEAQGEPLLVGLDATDSRAVGR